MEGDADSRVRIGGEGCVEAVGGDDRKGRGGIGMLGAHRLAGVDVVMGEGERAHERGRGAAGTVAAMAGPRLRWSPARP